MIRVQVKNGKLDPALKIWKRKVKNTKQLREIRERREFTKPSTKKRLSKQKSIYKEQQRRLSDQ
jgi:small subunit ribosomal protein S21